MIVAGARGVRRRLHNEVEGRVRAGCGLHPAFHQYQDNTRASQLTRLAKIAAIAKSRYDYPHTYKVNTGGLVTTEVEVRQNREIWVAGLLGNGKRKYAQTTGKLSNRFRSFCCLAVAAEELGDRFDISRLHGTKSGYRTVNASTGDTRTDFSALPQALWEPLGINSMTNRFLTVLNDSNRRKFVAIADVILALPILGKDDVFIERCFWKDNPELRARVFPPKLAKAGSPV